MACEACHILATIEESYWASKQTEVDVTQRIFIVVKGSAHDAEQTAKRHDIGLTVTGESANGKKTYCEAPMSERAKVIEWYSRDAGWGGTFGLGSCLWYTYRD